MPNDSRKIVQEIQKRLPPVWRIARRDEADYYGAAHAVAKALKRRWKPKSFAGWKHGWLYGDLKFKEQLTGGVTGYDRYLVAREEQALFLRRHGLEAEAVGMPFIYVHDRESVPRYGGSVLVMPPHSLPYTCHRWHEELFAEEVAALRREFAAVVACVHPSCVEKGLWTEAFEKRGIPWIVGADASDGNALRRMHRIFRSFEYMVTNTVGSHVVYAAYCGCRVSFFGTYQEYTAEDFRNDPAYRRMPHLLEHNIAQQKEEHVRKKYPFLFVPPAEAELCQSWAAGQLGENHRVGYEDLAKMLGWSWQRQLRYYVTEWPAEMGKKVRRRVFGQKRGGQ